MTYLMSLLLMLASPLTSALELEPAKFPWAERLKAEDVEQFHVCGDASIQPSKRGLEKSFQVGDEKKGYLFSDLISSGEYFNVLEKENLEEAKAELIGRFKEARLWMVDKDGKVKDLGLPTRIDLPFTATVKDCKEGAKTTLGTDCSKWRGDSLMSCCREKFVGPKVSWGGKEEYQLLFSPDPSVRFKVIGEKKHRYCEVQKRVSI